MASLLTDPRKKSRRKIPVGEWESISSDDSSSGHSDRSSRSVRSSGSDRSSRSDRSHRSASSSGSDRSHRSDSSSGSERSSRSDRSPRSRRSSEREGPNLTRRSGGSRWPDEGSDRSSRTPRRELPYEYVTEGDEDAAYCTENGPLEVVLDDRAPGKLDIVSEKDLSHARPNKYPDPERGYIDTTYVDPQKKELDVSYQKLKRLDPSLYRGFKQLVSLYLNHNSLVKLPEPELLPLLEDLDCSSNQILDVPYYPRLERLVARNNTLKSCSEYHRSHLTYLDVSYNVGIHLDIDLPDLSYLIATECQLSVFTLENLPSIKYIDLSSNRLREIVGSSETLLELSVSDNRLTSVPETPNLQCLFAESNLLSSLPDLGDLTTLEVSKNCLTSLGRYPRLVRLVASHNQITEIGFYPRVTNVELGFNLLESFVTPPRILHASIHFNPIKRVEITPESLSQIRELQLPFPAYRQIYKEYYDAYESVSIHVARERLDVYLERLTPPYSPREVQRMIREISLVKFPNRADGVYRIAIKTYYNHLKQESGAPPSLRQIADSPPFQTFLKTLDTVYEKSLLVNMYFNGYRG